MGETLYSTLGVAEDAEFEAIRRAYRDRVKEYHPDVADDPGATRTFKRLTAARDVLVDETERARYDRLGHDVYVSRHLGSTVWETAGGSGATTGPDPGNGPRSASTVTDGAGATATNTTAGAARHRRSRDGSYDRSSWLGADWEGSSGVGGRTASAAGGEASWQSASDVYRSTPGSQSTPRESRLDRIRRGVSALGPWLLVHLAFVGSAIAMGWFTWAQGDTGVIQVTPATVLAGLVLFALVVGLSVLHIVSLLYS